MKEIVVTMIPVILCVIAGILVDLILPKKNVTLEDLSSDLRTLYIMVCTILGIVFTLFIKLTNG